VGAAVLVPNSLALLNHAYPDERQRGRSRLHTNAQSESRFAPATDPLVIAAFTSGLELTMKMVPALRACMLSMISDETRLIVYGGEIAFVGMPHPHDPQRNRWLAVRDGQQFVRLLPTDREVLEIARPYIIEPGMSSYAPSRLGSSAGLQLFIHDTEPLVVLHPGSSSGWRVFNVSTGVSSSSAETDMGAFSTWRVGVPDAAGAPRWLIEII
jgi:hypothetical protein